MWDDYVVDATMGCRNGLLIVNPVETNEMGEITSVIFGANYIGFIPDGGRLVGVIHENGNDAAEVFASEYEDEIKALIEDTQ